jgi:Domain of unknown function (DUF1788)
VPSLADDFQELADRLAAPSSFSASRSDPFYYFVYPPESALEVRRQLPVLAAKLRNAGVTVRRVSFSDLLWELIDESGRWSEWIELEPDFDQKEVNDSIRSVVGGGRLVEKVAAIVSVERPRSVVFLTETEMLHPYFRVRTLESTLHDRVRVPTVVFYPGTRAGQFGLRFLGFYSEDGNYRAMLVGGQR